MRKYPGVEAPAGSCPEPRSKWGPFAGAALQACAVKEALIGLVGRRQSQTAAQSKMTRNRPGSKDDKVGEVAEWLKAAVC